MISINKNSPKPDTELQIDGNEIECLKTIFLRVIIDSHISGIWLSEKWKLRDQETDHAVLFIYPYSFYNQAYINTQVIYLQKLFYWKNVLSDFGRDQTPWAQNLRLHDWINKHE